MEPEMDNAVQIAIIKEQLNGIREQQKAHSETVNTSISDLKFSVNVIASDQKLSTDALTKKIDELTAIMNRGRGAFAASMIIAGGLGALVLCIIESLAHLFHKGG